MTKIFSDQLLTYMIATILLIAGGESVSCQETSRSTTAFSRQQALLLSILAYGRGGEKQVPGENYLAKTAAALVDSGGFDMDQIRKALGMARSEHESIAKVFARLERLESRRENREKSELPRLQQYPMLLAAVYHNFPEDGKAASAILAGELSDDPFAPDCGKILYALTDLILNGKTDKREILRACSRSTDLPKLAASVRAARISEWKDLEPGDDARARLLRVLRVWHDAEGFEAALAEAGKRKLCAEETAAVVCLATASEGIRALPQSFTMNISMSADTDGLISDLRNLSESKAILPVAKIARAPEEPIYSRSTGPIKSEGLLEKADALSARADRLAGKNALPAIPETPKKVIEPLSAKSGFAPFFAFPKREPLTEAREKDYPVDPVIGESK